MWIVVVTILLLLNLLLPKSVFACQQISCYQPETREIKTFNVCNCTGQVACLLGNDGSYNGSCYQESQFSQTPQKANFVSVSKKVLVGFLVGYAIFYFTVKLFKKILRPRKSLIVYS